MNLIYCEDHKATEKKEALHRAENKVAIGADVPASLVKRVRRYAEKSGLRKGFIIADALDKYLTQRGY